MWCRVWVIVRRGTPAVEGGDEDKPTPQHGLFFLTLFPTQGINPTIQIPHLENPS
jgi:hypothetical protein